MKQMIKIIRKADIAKQFYQSLLIEQDYELDSLSHALKSCDQTEIERSKRRLLEISVELKGLELHERMP